MLATIRECRTISETKYRRNSVYSSNTLVTHQLLSVVAALLKVPAWCQVSHGLTWATSITHAFPLAWRLSERDEVGGAVSEFAEFLGIHPPCPFGMSAQPHVRFVHTCRIA